MNVEKTIEIRVLLNFDAKVNLMFQKFQKLFNLIMHVFVRRIIINFQIDHVLKLLKMCFHVKIKIGELNILHQFFIVDKFAISVILNQFFFAVVLINHDYRKNNIYVICINFEMIRFAVLKMMNRFDKLNIDRNRMFEKILILKNFAILF